MAEAWTDVRPEGRLKRKLKHTQSPKGLLQSYQRQKHLEGGPQMVGHGHENRNLCPCDCNTWLAWPPSMKSACSLCAGNTQPSRHRDLWLDQRTSPVASVVTGVDNLTLERASSYRMQARQL